MVHRILTLAAILIVASAATASATSREIRWWAIHSGVTCGFGTGPQGRGVACIQTSRKGYVVTLTHSRVMVTRQDGEVVFRASQP